MYPPNNQLEWQFMDEADEQAPPAQSPTDAETDSAPHGATRWLRFYELIVGAAILYGIMLYFVWQQTAHRMIALEQEIVALRGEISQHADLEVENSDGVDTVATITGDLAQVYRFETDHLQFRASARSAEMVKPLVQPSSAQYQQLHRDFGVALPTTGEMLLIVIDPGVGVGYPLTNENVLVILLPTVETDRYGISQMEALENEIHLKLTQHVFQKALSGREISPQWRAMTLALETHIQFAYGRNPNWRFDSMLLSYRHRAQSRSLELVQDVHYTPVDQAETEPGFLVSPTAYATANPLIEYILETHGYAILAPLLDAFEEHDSWETLAPAVFGISAGELEADWHAYLQQEYPRSVE